ncbi:ATP-binding protein [Candidatus Margulisiibacteriota bacterium]
MGSILSYTFIIFCSITLVVGAFVFHKDYTNRVYRSWFIFCVSVFLWGFSLGIYTLVSNINIANMFHAVNYVGAVTIPLTFLYFIRCYVVKTKKITIDIIIVLLVAVINLYLFFTGRLCAPLTPKWQFSYYTSPEKYYWVYMVSFFITLFYSFYLMLKKYFITKGNEKVKIGYLISATALGFLGGSTAFFLVFDKEVPFFTSFPPYGIYLFMFAPFIITYSILKHHLMDITLVIRKSLIYSALIASLSCLYALGVFLFGLASISRSQSIWFSILSIIVLATVCHPLQNYIQRFIDKIFFRNKYDYYQALKEVSEQMRTVVRLDDLVRTLLRTVPNAIKVKEVSFYGLSQLEQSPIQEWLLQNRRVFIKGADSFTATATATATELPAVSIPLFAADKLLGIFNLGEKLSEEPYSGEDIQLLTTIANQATVVLENIEANQKLIEAERLATLGKIAAGLAHEIKNPITAMNSFVQLMPLREGDNEYYQKLYETQNRQLKRMNDLVMDLLKLGKPIQLNITEFDLKELLQKVIDLIRPQCGEQRVTIEMITNNQPLTTIKADREQMYQVFLNLVQNAVQSMPDGGPLTLKLTTDNQQLTTVSFRDTGPGIPPEQLKSIFEPFYTTRTEGTGLGLAIVKKILDEHGFEIEVESEAGSGTIVRVVIG